MDISKQEEVEAKIFQNIVKNGPISIYAASRKKNPQNPPFSTVHRHFKKLEQEGMISIYKKEMHQNKKFKKLYGPTLYGVGGFYFSDKGIPKKNIEHVFEKWGNHEKFFKPPQGSDVIFKMDDYKKNPKKMIENYQKWIELNSLALNEFNEDIPEELELEIGMMLLGRKDQKFFLERVGDLYNNVESYRTSMDSYFKNLLLMYRFMKEFKSFPNNPHNITKLLLMKYEPMLNPDELKKIQSKKEPKYDFELVDRNPRNEKLSKSEKNTKINGKKISELEKKISNVLLHNFEIHLKYDQKNDVENNLKYAMAYISNIIYNATTPTIKREVISLTPHSLEYNLKLIKNANSVDGYKELIKNTAGKVIYRYRNDGPSTLAFHIINSKNGEEKLVAFIDPYSDEGGPETQKFYDNFELFVPNMDDSPSESSIEEDLREDLRDDLDAEDRRDIQWYVDDRFEEKYDEVFEEWFDGERVEAEKRWKIRRENLGKV